MVGSEAVCFKNKGYGISERAAGDSTRWSALRVERWALQKYTSITPKTNFKLFNTFADKDENPELPGSDWDLNFSEQDGTTTVSISIYNESLERLERMVAMGFKEGTAATFENLKELLATLSQKRLS